MLDAWSYDKCWEGYTHVLLIFKVQDAIAFSLQNQQGHGRTNCTIAAAPKQENNALQARQMFTENKSKQLHMCKDFQLE